MKKKLLLIIVVSGILLVGLLTILFSGEKIIENQIEYTEVYRGSFQRQKKYTATVISGIHTYGFSGNIIEIYKNKGDEVSKKDVILKYTDMYGNSKKAVSSVKGIITDISSGQIVINDYNFGISCYVDIETRNRLKLNSQHLLKTYNDTLLTEIEYISILGEEVNNQLLYEIRLKIIRGNEVLLKQQGTLYLNLEQLENVLLVDRRAVLKDEKGYYLLDCGWVNDAGNFNEYRIDIRVIEMNEMTAVIDGIDLEQQQVLILTENLKELLK